MGPTFLLIFLLINVFLAGVLVTIGVQHALAHFRPDRAARKGAAPVQLPPAVRQELLEEARKRFESILLHAEKELQQSVTSTASELNGNLQKIGSDIIKDEMKRYHDSLEELRAQTEITIGGAQTEVKDHQTEIAEKLDARKAELQAQLEADATAEKQRLLEAIDTRLNDAVTSFLLETLGHEADLGAQSSYIMAQLDAHKDDFKRGVSE